MLACVFFRDVHFREKESPDEQTTGVGVNATRRHGDLPMGPDCLLPDGMIAPSFPILTGHIGFGAPLLSRIGTRFTAVIFLREPISRLISLFNMYPPGTWSSVRHKENGSLVSPAAREFISAYRSSIAGRNALTCFSSGDVLCDSRGAIDAAALTAASLARAQYNLLYRFTAFGMSERLQESIALITHALGWHDFFTSSSLDSNVHVTPGASHRRLELHDLCAVEGFIDEMAHHEALDIDLHSFALSVFEQRLITLPNELREIARRRGSRVGEYAAATPLNCAESDLINFVCCVHANVRRAT